MKDKWNEYMKKEKQKMEKTKTKVIWEKEKWNEYMKKEINMEGKIE